MALFDSSLTARAVPAGSLRYFAWLYTPEAQRDALAATFLINAELRDSANAPHEVAHVRLQWWRDEVNNLMAGRAQHPATRLLQHSPQAQHIDFAVLHDAVQAAAQDLATSTFDNDQELQRYLQSSGGAITTMTVAILNEGAVPATLQAAAERIGSFTRRVETLRDLRNDIHHGRLYLPLSRLDELQIGHDALNSRDWPPALVSYIRQRCHETLQSHEELQRSLLQTERITLRPLLVLGELHTRLLKKLAHDPDMLTRQRLELGPFEKPWIAWRAARRAT